jgi:hypothetical protein
MISNQSFLYYGAPVAEVEKFYPNQAEKKSPFKATNGEIFITQLPKNLAAIRVIAGLAFAAHFALGWVTPWKWAVAAVGLAFAGWTIYRHFLRHDPLVETFYKIAGGKQAFDDIPKLDLAPYDSNIFKMDIHNWESLQGPIYRSETADGRQILVVKGLNRVNQTAVGPDKVPEKSIKVFVEKFNYSDKYKQGFMDNLLDQVSMVFNYNNEPFEVCDTNSTDSSKKKIEFLSSMTSEMAHEFFLQLRSYPT